MRTGISLACGMFAAVAFAQSPATVVLNGQPHALSAHPRVWFNPSVVSGVADPDGSGSGVARKATSANPPWIGTQFVASYTAAGYSDVNNQFGLRTGVEAAAFAIHWYSDHTQTASLTAALYMLDHLEQFVPFYCDESHPDCMADGGTGYGITSYGAAYWLPNWIFAYELMRGEMTTAERQAFADKILNDVSAFGGVGGSASTSCTNPSAHPGVAVTIAGGAITASAPLFGAGNAIQAGDWVIMDAASAYNMAKVAGVTDNVHAVLNSNDANAFNGYSGTLSTRRAAWQAGDCGFLWHIKHDRWTARSVTYRGASSLYLPDGGMFGDSYYHNLTISSMWGMLPALLSVADDDANFASRSGVEITALYNEWHDNVWALQENSYTGRHQTGETYGLWRAMYFYPGIAFAVANSTAGGPAVTSGVWAKNMLYQYFMNSYPSAPRGQMGWGQPLGGASAGLTSGAGGAGVAELIQMYAGTNEGKWANWWMQHRLSNGNFDTTPGTGLEWDVNNGSLWQNHNYGYMPWIYAWTDPAFAASDLTATAPTAVALNTSDTGATPTNMLISRTGYSSVVDTLLNMEAPWEPAQDHNLGASGFAPGSYKIFKGGYLLAADNGGANDWTDPQGATGVEGGDHSMYMEIGGAYNLTNGPSNMKAPPFVSKMPRANTDGTNNRFAYAMTDSTASYASKAGATRVYRHLVDFKKAGSQQFIIVYDDVATSSGQMKRTYLHYPNSGKGYAGQGSTVFSQAAATVVSTFNGFGRDDGSQLLTQVLKPGGAGSVAVYTDRGDGSYAGGNGQTFRVSVCASVDGATCNSANRSAEFLVVHEPVAGAGNSMPEASMMTVDADWRGVQIGGSSPKVALFARNGQLRNRVQFTATHSGTAQIVVAGLRPGTYAVHGPTEATASVGTDGVLYIEGPAGTYSAGQSIPPCEVRGKACVKGNAEIR